MNLLVADGEGQRLVQTGRETPPGDWAPGLMQATHFPDITVNRHQHAGAVLQELHVAGTNVTPPGILDGELEVVDDEGVSGRRQS